MGIQETIINEIKKVGRKEGIKVGKEENNLEIARKMKAEGLDIALIAKITGLKEEEIKKL